MGIKFDCSECTHRIHVKTFLAGKRAICPHCGAKVLIPQEESQNGSARSDGPRATAETALTETAPTETAAPVVNVGQASGVVAQPAVAAQPASVTSVPTPVAATAAAPTAAAQAAVSDPISEAPSAVWYVRPKGGGQYGPAPGVTMRQWIDEGRVSVDSLVWREGWDEWQSASVLIAPAAATQVGSVATGVVTPPDVTILTPADGASAGGDAVTVRRKSNAMGLAVIVFLGIMAVSLVVILIIIIMSQ